MRIRPAFLWLLFGFILFALLLPDFLPEPSAKKKAIVIFTRFETKEIGTALKQYFTETGNLTNIDKNFVIHAVLETKTLGTNESVNSLYHSERTNSQGEILDSWQTPYKIEFLEQTNFIVHSAGPNKIFGDADDIIFNSVSNDFV